MKANDRQERRGETSASRSAYAAAPVVQTREVTVISDAARTWWDLAVTHLGDGAAWRELWDLNLAGCRPTGPC